MIDRCSRGHLWTHAYTEVVQRKGKRPRRRCLLCAEIRAEQRAAGQDSWSVRKRLWERIFEDGVTFMADENEVMLFVPTDSP